MQNTRALPDLRISGEGWCRCFTWLQQREFECVGDISSNLTIMTYTRSLSPQNYSLVIIKDRSANLVRDLPASAIKDICGSNVASVDGLGLRRVSTFSLHPAAFLADNLFITGPTFTNVIDFRAIVVDRP